MKTNIYKKNLTEAPDTSLQEVRHYYLKEHNEPKKWCWTKFITGFLKHKLIAFLVTTALVIWIISWLMYLHSTPGSFVSDGLMVFFYIVGVVWGVTIFIFILSGAIDNMVSNAKLNMEIKAGAQANLNADAAEIIKTVKGGGK